MRYGSIGSCLVAAGLLFGAAAPASAQINGWDVSGTPEHNVPLPTGSYNQDQSGVFTAAEFIFMHQTRAIGSQVVAIRGFYDSTGGITGTPGQFVGSGAEALNTNQIGRTTWEPGFRATVGYRFDTGWTLSASYLHLASATYSAHASVVTQNFQGLGANLENSFLYSGVFNFAVQYAGPFLKANNVNGLPAPGAVYGIWNGAIQEDIKFTQRFDNVDITARMPVFETDYSRTYALAGGRFAWFWEGFQWRTFSQSIDPAVVALGQDPRDGAVYSNVMSQRMYGPFIGCGNEIYAGNGFGLGVEMTAAALLDITKERAKYYLDDQTTENKHTGSTTRWCRTST